MPWSPQHHGYKPGTLQCIVRGCPTTFKVDSGLKRHLRSVHPDIYQHRIIIDADSDEEHLESPSSGSMSPSTRQSPVALPIDTQSAHEEPEGQGRSEGVGRSESHTEDTGGESRIRGVGGDTALEDEFDSELGGNRLNDDMPEGS